MDHKLTTQDAVKILEEAKKRKISFCKKHGFPIPLFDKADDFLIDSRISCPKCGSKKGYIAFGKYTMHYNSDGSPSGYTLDDLKLENVMCSNCWESFSRKELWEE